MRRAVFLLLCLLVVPLTAHADYDRGLRAYLAGDYADALSEWKATASQGEAAAQYRLGRLYEDGLGAPLDLVAAHLYYHLAAAQDHAKARRARDSIAQKMTEADQAEAQRLAVTWTPLDAASAPPDLSPKPPSTAAEALLMATELGRTDVVKTLLLAGTDANTSDPEGWTSLSGAALGGHTEIARLLIDAGANARVTSRGGATPLMAAALTGRQDIAQMLLEAGADPHVRNAAEASALSFAERERDADMIELLAAAVGLSQVEIAEAQRLLERRGYLIGRSDGVFSLETESAIRAYQAELGFPIDGRLTKELLGYLWGQTPNTRERNAEAQRLLADLGFDPGPLDGFVGPKTGNAVRDFQIAIGVAADGKISDSLFEQLRNWGADAAAAAADEAPIEESPDATVPAETSVIATTAETGEEPSAETPDAQAPPPAESPAEPEPAVARVETETALAEPDRTLADVAADRAAEDEAAVSGADEASADVSAPEQPTDAAMTPEQPTDETAADDAVDQAAARDAMDDAVDDTVDDAVAASEPGEAAGETAPEQLADTAAADEAVADETVADAADAAVADDAIDVPMATERAAEQVAAATDVTVVEESAARVDTDEAPPAAARAGISPRESAPVDMAKESVDKESLAFAEPAAEAQTQDLAAGVVDATGDEAIVEDDSAVGMIAIEVTAIEGGESAGPVAHATDQPAMARQAPARPPARLLADAPLPAEPPAEPKERSAPSPIEVTKLEAITPHPVEDAPAESSSAKAALAPEEVLEADRLRDALSKDLAWIRNGNELSGTAAGADAPATASADAATAQIQVAVLEAPEVSTRPQPPAIAPALAPAIVPTTEPSEEAAEAEPSPGRERAAAPEIETDRPTTEVAAARTEAAAEPARKSIEPPPIPETTKPRPSSETAEAEPVAKTAGAERRRDSAEPPAPSDRAVESAAAPETVEPPPATGTTEARASEAPSEPKPATKPAAIAPSAETPSAGEPVRLAAVDPVSVSNVFDVIYSTGTPDVIARYLVQGGDPNAETKTGFSLLSAAVSMGNAAIAERLIRAGANLNRRAGNGETPLTSAIRSIRKDRILEMVELLLDSGADPNLGIEGSPPLYLAVTLIKQDTALLARALLDAGAIVNGQASGGITTLEIAVQTCFLESSKQANRETIETLLNYGARITNNTASLLYRYADIGVCQNIYDLFDARGIRLN